MQIKQMNGESLQLFAPDAAKSQVNTVMTGDVVFKKGTGGTVNINNWCAIRVVALAAASYYFNTDTTKTMPLPAGVPVDIWCISSDITQVVLVLGVTTASVQGM